MSEPRTELHLEVDPKSDPITGLLRDRAGRTQPFEGWMQLIAEVERACSLGPGGSRPEPDKRNHE